MQHSALDASAESEIAARACFTEFEQSLRQQRTRSIWPVMLILLLGCVFLAIVWRIGMRPFFVSQTGLMVFMILCGFRWLLKALHLVRAGLYRGVVYPRLCQKAPRDSVKRILVVIPIYHEQPWIMRLVLERVVAELEQLTQPAMVLVCVGTPSDQILMEEAVNGIFLKSGLDVIVRLQESSGKRGALAESLRYLAQRYPTQNGLIVLMDGDSVWDKGLLQRIVPLFAAHPTLGAVTTDEEVFCPSSHPYRLWFSFRMAIRDFYMSSHALSRRLLCLTGRFSVIRTEAALNPGFIKQLADDGIDHWLFDRIRFLGGDDKSSWYWLYTKGEALGIPEMLYMPDIKVVTIESVTERPWARIVQNMRRWFINTARNNGRSLVVLPFWRTPGFIWLALFMQRGAIYCNVLAMALLLTMGLGASREALMAAVWLAVLSAVLTFLCLSLLGRRVNWSWLFWLLFERWLGSFVKLWCLSNLADQKWLHRGGQISGANQRHWAAQVVAWIHFAASIGFLVGLAVWLCRGGRAAF